MIRAALGETAFLELVDPAVFSYPEIGVTILGRIFQEWQPGVGEVTQLLSGAQEATGAAGASSAELTAGERDWFGAGMLESPFAVWPDETQDRRA
jgi:hypothetical protein